MKLNHWVVIAAVIIGVLNIAPYLTAYFFIPSEVQINQTEKLHFFYQDSELIYLGRIREVMEGKLGIASLAFLEYKDEPVIQQPFGEWLYAAISLGKPNLLPSVALLTKAIFPALLFVLLFFSIRFFLIKEKLSSTLAIIISGTLAWLISSGVDVYRPQHLFNFLFFSNSIEPHLSIWTRIVNPITGMLGLVAVIMLMARADGPFRLYRGIILGLIVGFSSGYIFSFGLILAYGVVIASIWFVYREWARIQEGMIATVVAVLCNYTFVISIFNMLGSDGESLGKNGLFYTTTLLINKGFILGFFVFVVSLLYFVHIEKSTIRALFARPWWRFSGSFLIATFVCYSQQIFTGKTVWPQHFIQYTDPLILVIIFGSLALVFMSVTKYLQIWKSTYTQWAVSASAIIIIGIVTTVQINMIPKVFSYTEKYADSQRYIESLNWLQDRLGGGPCVVLPLETGQRIERYIFAYTGCDLYHSNYVYMSVPEKRILHNYITHLRLLGVTSETINLYLDENFFEWQHLFFRDWYDKFSEKPDPWLQAIAKPNQKEEFYNTTKVNIESAFNQSLDVPIKDWLLKYQIDYIIVDRKHDDVMLDETVFIPRTSNNQITIYEVVVQ